MSELKTVYEIKVCHFNEPGLDALREKIGAARPRPAQPGDVRLVLHDGKTAVGTCVMNVAWGLGPLDVQMGCELKVPKEGFPFPIVTLVDAWAVGDTRLLAVLVRAALEIVSKAEFSGGEQIMYVLAVGTFLAPNFHLLEDWEKDLRVDIHHALDGVNHAAGLHKSRFMKALEVLRDAERTGDLPVLSNPQMLRATVLHGARRRTRIAEGWYEPAGDNAPVSSR